MNKQIFILKEKAIKRTLNLFFNCIKENNIKEATNYVKVSEEKLIENLSLLYKTTKKHGHWTTWDDFLSKISFDKSDINYQIEENKVKELDLGILYNNRNNDMAAIFKVKSNKKKDFLEFECFKEW